jgi:predicted DNA-binding protein
MVSEEGDTMVMKRIPLQLSEEMHEQVRQAAHDTHCSMADIIRQAIQEYIIESPDIRKLQNEIDRLRAALSKVGSNE